MCPHFNTYPKNAGKILCPHPARHGSLSATLRSVTHSSTSHASKLPRFTSTECNSWTAKCILSVVLEFMHGEVRKFDEMRTLMKASKQRSNSLLTQYNQVSVAIQDKLRCFWCWVHSVLWQLCHLDRNFWETWILLGLQWNSFSKTLKP